jgi:hypothetical protein
MATVNRFLNVYGNSSITYNGTFLPYGITTPELHFTDEDPISPPCSPRPDGVQEIRPMAIFHEPIYEYGLHWVYTHELYNLEEDIKKRHNKFYRKNKNTTLNTKHFRRNHKLKQPGGSSCNQRR